MAPLPPDADVVNAVHTATPEDTLNISQLNGSYAGSSGADGVGSSIGGGTSSMVFPSYSNEHATYGGDGFQSQYPSIGNGNTSTQNGSSGGGMMSALMSMMSGLMEMMQNLAASILGNSSSANGTGTTATGLTNGAQADPQTAFTNASVSSTGDPHLAISGTEQNGATTSNTFDSMVGHHDLVDSDSIPGGFRVSTTVTSPINGNGVTLNQSATVHSNFGQNAVTLNNAGTVTVTKDGAPVSLTVGQPTKLGDGETVTQNANGSVTVVNSNHQGGSVTTTMSLNGGANGTGGVDVTTTAKNVDLGGDIVNGVATPQQQTPSAANSGGFNPYGSDFSSFEPSSLLSTESDLRQNLFNIA